MLKIAITGNIGSGKSTVARFFQNLGVPVFFADKAGHNVLKKNEVIEKLRQLFGDMIFDKTGELNRKNIAAIVFSDPQKLQQLNAVTHPEIKEMIFKWIEEQHLNRTKPYLIVEAAVLFEAGFDVIFDKIIVVAAPKNLRIKRVMNRDNTTETSAKQRINAQISEEKKIKKSDFTIINDEIEPIIPQILKIDEILSKLAMEN